MGSTRYSTPPGPSYPHTPGTPSRHRHYRVMTSLLPHGHAGQRNSAVGLKSVDQLTLVVLFSGLRGMTEVYNLATAGNR